MQLIISETPGQVQHLFAWCWALTRLACALGYQICGFANTLHVNVMQPEFLEHFHLIEEHVAPPTLPRTARVQHQVRTLAGIRSGPSIRLSFTHELR